MYLSFLYMLARYQYLTLVIVRKLLKNDLITKTHYHTTSFSKHNFYPLSTRMKTILTMMLGLSATSAMSLARHSTSEFSEPIVLARSPMDPIRGAPERNPILRPPPQAHVRPPLRDDPNSPLRLRPSYQTENSMGYGRAPPGNSGSQNLAGTDVVTYRQDMPGYATNNRLYDERHTQGPREPSRAYLQNSPPAARRRREAGAFAPRAQRGSTSSSTQTIVGPSSHQEFARSLRLTPIPFHRDLASVQYAEDAATPPPVYSPPRQGPSTNSPPIYSPPPVYSPNRYSPEYSFVPDGFSGYRPSQPRMHKKREDLLAKISAESSNSNMSASAEFQIYLNEYHTIQGNISDSLFSLFETVLNGTNSSVIYDTVWSIHSDLTGLGPHVVGPFSYGRHCFDWIEDQYLHGANRSNTTDPAILDMFATHQALIGIYQDAWPRAFALATASGFSEMVILSQYLLPKDQSIAPAEWTRPKENFDTSYFTRYNSSLSYSI